ncbi:MAG: hypothetical protein CL943_02050 [Candidatus Diapherotrites archaeon]|uniref:Circularly permuted type 2 ATP-grasp protein n=1 Tax=Candidatus Iainarchaeum sp. TaxID=3101447 RepID=A0A2D6M0X0_9ARCH|nr:hypothetical protein [Candidatus Diapherotrites archaeon]|tara:strand:- start:3577 stop:4662 length:1086 start_codon:yes stop_codon:yes gene_type:complete
MKIIANEKSYITKDIFSDLHHPGKETILPYSFSINKEMMHKWIKSGLEIIEKINTEKNYQPDCFAVDFAITKTESSLQPKLIELQSFASIFHSCLWLERMFFGEKNKLFNLTLKEREAIFLSCASPEGKNTIMLDSRFLQNRSGFDFVSASSFYKYSITPTSILDVYKHNNSMWYLSESGPKKIEHVYNRAIYHTLTEQESNILSLLESDKSITWFNKPSNYYSVNKSDLLNLSHPENPCSIPAKLGEKSELSSWVLKSKNGYAGDGLNLNPTKKDIADLISQNRIEEYILQERINYAPIFYSTQSTKAMCAELRIMFVLKDESYIPLCCFSRLSEDGNVSLSMARLNPGEGVAIFVEDSQ